MVTKNGIIKRTSLDLYKNIRRAGLIAINLDEGDELLYVLKTDGNCNMLLATHNGLSSTSTKTTRVRSAEVPAA